MKKIIFIILLCFSTLILAERVNLNFKITYENKLYPQGSHAIIETSMSSDFNWKKLIPYKNPKTYQINVKHVDDLDGLWFRFGNSCEFIYGIDWLVNEIDVGGYHHFYMEVVKESNSDEEECWLTMRKE